MSNPVTGWIGISLGDVAGIGPEVTLKSLAAVATEDETKYLLLGDAGQVAALNGQLGLHLDLHPFRRLDSGGRFFVHDARGASFAAIPDPGSAELGQAALVWLRDGARRCLCSELDALVTAPVNKETIIRSEPGFVGQTEFLSRLAEAGRTAMMLLGHDDRKRWLRVALVTTHLPLRKVADEITPPKVEQTIELAAQACRELHLPRARVGVCGLNPHAGEGGRFGDEETRIIDPAVRATSGRGIDVFGPLPADTLFYQAFRGNYDAVVAMYHDQGLAPLKMIGFDSGVNWTLGLPFIRTSPDHGTAYDLAGRGKASPLSMMAAIRLAKQLAGGRR